MPKAESPLKAAQVEGDKLKVKIDEFVAKYKEILENSGLADKQTQMKEQLKRCKEITNEVTKLEKKVAKLKKSQEPTTVSKFDEKKQDELKRLASFKVQLGKIGDTLEPDEVEEDYFRQVNENNNEEDEDEDDSNEETDESEDSEEESHDTTPGDDSITSEESSSTNQKPKLGRMGLFRRSSKLKDMRSKVPSKIEEEEEEEVEETNESKEEEGKEEEEEEDPAKTEVLSKKERKIKERREKFLEREAKEKEKREKKAKEKLEKERKEKEKKEQKEKLQMEKKEKAKKEQEEKVKGKAKEKKGKEKEKKELQDDDEDEEASEDEDVVSEDEESSEEEEDEEDEKQEESSKVADSKKKKKEDSKEVSDRRGSRSWFFRSKTPDRKQKSEMNDDSISSKKQSSKAKPVIESKVEDEDEEGDEEEEEDEEESEYEDEDDEEEEEEEESEEDETPVDSKRQPPKSKPEMVPSQSKSKPSAATGEEEEEDEDGESEDDEEEDSGEDEEDDEEEDEEEEEEEEEDDGNKLEETGSSDEEGDHPLDGENLFEVLCNFDAEEPTDLSVKQGNVVTILSTREDGWWMAEDEEGNKGLVPSTYLKLKRDSTDYKAVQSPEPEQGTLEDNSESGKELWKSVRRSIHETSATDVLTAMGAMPAGFRQSLTSRLLKNEQNKLSSFLKPKLSESNLSFKDLLWDPQSSQLRAVPCRIQKMLSVVLVRNMPAMGVGLETKCRHARIAIFDGQEVLSNIHTVQATWNEADLKTWRFSPKVSGILPSILDGECFIRTERSEKNIGLLIELCASYVRTKTGEKGEVSCGWVHLPLFSEETGGPILNKVYDLPVNGGTPFEQGVEVDPSISRKASSSKFRSMLTANKQPRLQIKLIAPTKEQKAQLETLPFTIVSVTSYLPLLSFYRRILADAILRDRIDVQSTELIHSPLLTNFPKAADLPDVMDGLRSMWAEKKRSTKKSEKRDAEQMKSLFTSAFMESAYPVLHSATLPEYHWPDIESEQIRWESISNFTTVVQQKGILASLLSPGKMHTPFHTSEVSFDILGAYTNR